MTEKNPYERLWEYYCALPFLNPKYAKDFDEFFNGLIEGLKEGRRYEEANDWAKIKSYFHARFSANAN